MGMFTKAECEAMRNRVLGNAPPPPNRRAKVGTGDLAKRKNWYAEMARGPGIFLPLVTKSEANMRDRWDTAERAAKNRLCIGFALKATYRGVLPPLPATITLTRYSKGLLDCHDNLRISMKACVDEIAKAYGVDDKNTELYQWVYKQEKGPTYGVKIEITSVADAGELEEK